MASIPIGDPPDDEPYPGTTFIPFKPKRLHFLPVIQPIFVPIPYYPPQPQRFSTRCPRCGLDWSGVMGYSCGNTACPMQAQITCTTTAPKI
jgi:hypothetical protein